MITYVQYGYRAMQDVAQDLGDKALKSAAFNDFNVRIVKILNDTLMAAADLFVGCLLE